MKAWSLFYPDVMPELPGAPSIMVDHWLRNAAIELCERSRVHVVMLDAESSVTGENEYDLTPPANMEIHEVIGVSYSDEPMEPRSQEYLDSIYGTNWLDQTGTPTYYTQYESGKLILVPAPIEGITDAIKVRACLKPSTSATGVEDWLFSQFRLIIAEGAKGKMMAMAGDIPWKNPDYAAIYQARFELGINDAASRARKSLVRALPRFSGRFC